MQTIQRIVTFAGMQVLRFFLDKIQKPLTYNMPLYC